MKILYLTPYMPNPIRVRPFQILRALAERGHQITLGTLYSTPAEVTDGEYLRGLGIDVVSLPLTRARALANSLAALPTLTPLQANYCWHAQLAGRLAQTACTEPFDVIHVEHLRGARYGLHLQQQLRRCTVETPLVWDSVDCISHLFAQAACQAASRKTRVMAQFELSRTRRYEGSLVRQFDQTLVTSETDRQALAALAGPQAAERIRVLPNGVDLGYFRPDGGERLGQALVFTGKMSYHANVAAARYLVQEIMPLVWMQRPDVQVWLVGKDPGAEVYALAGGRGSAPGRVHVTGTVADIRPYLRRATIAVAPVPYGAGIQNKVLEAMACGAPVIASEQAVSALSAQSRQHLLVARNVHEFAYAILSLLASPVQRLRMGQAGHAYVEQHYAWSVCIDQLEQIYRTVRRRRAPIVEMAAQAAAF